MRSPAIDTLLFCAALTSAQAMHAQESGTTNSTRAQERALVLYAGGGMSHYPGTPGVPAHMDTRITSWAPSGTARLMWHPGHRLHVGLESGWTPVYSYSIDGPGATGSVHLDAVPLLLVWSMPLTERISLFAGYGTYRLTTTLDYLGSTRTSMFSMGYSAALSYVHPVSQRLGIDMELKWFNAGETRHTVLAAQLQLVWKLHTW